MKKVALLIGATAGIGRETAQLLAREGYHVLVVGRNQSAGQEPSATRLRTDGAAYRSYN